MSSDKSLKGMLDWLYALQRLGIKTGLEHTTALAEVCNNPQDKFPSIHIAGTNGKGSTSAMTASILRSAGYKVGLYTSPHLLRFNERVRVDGFPIDDEDIVEFVSLYRKDIDRIESTFFEVTSVLAWWYFYKQQVDVAIIETGLGGRLDSTNILKPRVTVITPVDFDHTELLGNSLAEIANEKAGIVKPGIPLVLAPQAEEADSVIRSRARDVGAPVAKVKTSSGKKPKRESANSTVSWRGHEMVVGLAGEHQAVNGLCALEAAIAFDSDISVEHCRSGLRNVVWPGRFQQLREDPPVFYDVAHNAHGIKALLDNLSDSYDGMPNGVMALKGDKELSLIIPVLKNRFNKLLVADVPGTDLISARDLSDRLKEAGIECIAADSIELAIESALGDSKGGNPLLIFGSHYVADSVFSWFEFSFEPGVI